MEELEHQLLHNLSAAVEMRDATKKRIEQLSSEIERLRGELTSAVAQYNKFVGAVEIVSETLKQTRKEVEPPEGHE